MARSAFDKTITNIPHNDNVAVASNEINVSETFNQNFEKLYLNDLTIANALSSFREGISRIERYNPSKVYKSGDIVFYVLYGRVDKATGTLIETEDIDSEPVENLYLIRSLGDENRTDPRKGFKIIDGISTFENNGVLWHNENPIGSIFFNRDPNTVALSDFFEMNLSSLFDAHEKDKSLHKFGELQDFNELSTKILLKTFENLDENRDRIFYPDEISSCSYFPAEEKILKKLMYKKWSKGILEYDIVFQLGDNDVVMEEHLVGEPGTSTYGIDRTHTCMAANFPENSISTILYSQQANYNISEKTPINPNWNDNDRYFLRPDDRTIFEFETGKRIEYNYNGVKQTNLNNKVNVFSGTIKFPIPFKDLNYMIFDSGTAVNTFDPQAFNKMAYINKTPTRVTALYLIASYEVDAPLRTVALRRNEFKIHVVGRWK